MVKQARFLEWDVVSSGAFRGGGAPDAGMDTEMDNTLAKTVAAAAVVLGASAAAGAAPADGAPAPWPLVAVRHTSGILSEPETFRRLLECHRRHPGAVDEFWFSAGLRKTLPALEETCAKIAALRPLCEEAGIALSYQQGQTLGHGGHDGAARPDAPRFPADAWQVGPDGSRLGMICPRSPDAIAYERDYAATVLRILSPGSFWLDDDLRLGVAHENGCFCDRCLAAFNAETGGAWTREALAAALFSSPKREPVRAAWSAFNARSLALFAAAVREAADALGSPCRLGYQAVWADCLYPALDYAPLLAALSGPARRPVGIRPGAGFYVEAEPREMVRKCLSVAREAERCRAPGAPPVAAVCYEQETYPRHVLHKSPGAIATECALALASGCDSLSLYWYAAEAPEPVEEYERFVRTLARARPYFERLAASARRTRLGGVARFVGSAAGETPGFDLRDDADFDLACAGVPVTVAGPGASVWYLTDKSRAETTEADRAALAAVAVVDVSGVEKYPLASRRAKLLDDLDRATGGAFPVRVDACRALRILPRVRADGRVDSVTLLNLSIGSTDELAVRVRRPVSHAALLQDPATAEPVPLPCAPGALPDETIVVLPDLPGWHIVTVFFEDPREPSNL